MDKHKDFFRIQYQVISSNPADLQVAAPWGPPHDQNLASFSASLS
jgi:hypothetical protein